MGFARIREPASPCSTEAQRRARSPDLLRGMLAALQFQGKGTPADLWAALGSPEPEAFLTASSFLT